MAPNEVLSLTQFSARRHQAPFNTSSMRKEGKACLAHPVLGRGRIMGLGPLKTVQTSWDSVGIY